MKKVRFESPLKIVNISMELEECHSPRPYIENNNELLLRQGYEPTLRKFEDPVEKYDTSNSSPLWPALQKKTIVQSSCTPSNELDLSFFDPTDRRKIHNPPSTSTYKSPRQVKESVFDPTNRRIPLNPVHNCTDKSLGKSGAINIYSSQTVTDFTLNEERNLDFQHKVNNSEGFFIRPQNSLHNIHHFQVDNVINSHKNVLSEKHNNCNISKLNYVQNVSPCYTNYRNNVHEKENKLPQALCDICCNSNNCNNAVINSSLAKPTGNCYLPMTNQTLCHHLHHSCAELSQQTIKCRSNSNNNDNKTPIIKTSVDKKSWCVEKYERSKKGQDAEMQNNIESIEENSEPTVSDLIKIIKIQNEQIQLLQQKVDKVISNTEHHVLPSVPIEYRAEQVKVQTVDNNHHKISIGVMTSFEMLRTSAFINNEYSKNPQVQCNTSQILIKEVLSKTKPVVEEQFLKGIAPIDNVQLLKDNVPFNDINYTRNTCNEDKTVNDLSLCNLIIDNPITPQISPDQSIYLDVRDYSDSDDDNTAVGWTYYNKVMSHVNGMLQDSDIPTSAAAMQHNAKQNLQIQIDRSNVSITKRVTFGEDTIRMHQPDVPATSTDTSMRMNQLAQKYLKNNAPQSTPQVYTMTKPHPTVDMSFATRNYMERHQLLHAECVTSSRPPSLPIPKFLDITALKKQPKLL